MENIHNQCVHSHNYILTYTHTFEQMAKLDILPMLPSSKQGEAGLVGTKEIALRREYEDEVRVEVQRSFLTNVYSFILPSLLFGFFRYTFVARVDFVVFPLLLLLYTTLLYDYY